MNAKTLLAGTTIALALTAAAATPANAAIETFATFSAVGLDNFYYNNPSSTGKSASATFYSYTDPAVLPAHYVPAPGAVAVTFSFINEGATLDNAVKGVSAILVLNGTTSGPAQLDPFSHNLEQFTSGTFSLKSTAPILVGTHLYAAGSTLLQGSFGNAVLSGKSTSGGIAGDNDPTFSDTLSYSSDFVTFKPSADLDISVALTSIIPALADAKVGTYALKSFKTDASGQFSADPVPKVNAVPEPASWALMIVGFGLAGASVRRRARVQAAV